MKLDELPLVMTIPEVASALRIGRNQAYRLAESGEIGAIRLGNTWRVPRHRLEELLRAGQAEEGRPSTETR